MIYQNRLRSKKVLAFLNDLGSNQTILEVGGGFQPYYRSTHIVDIQPYSKSRLSETPWGGHRVWERAEYTQLDVCESRQWPFDDKSFDVGYSSHLLEDVRDPIHPVREMQRICKKVIIETPSRLCEQTRGIEHERWCGFWHHRWLVYKEGEALIFQKKTPVVELPGCHYVLKPWERVESEGVSFYFVSEGPFPVLEKSFWPEQKEMEDLKKFIRKNRHQFQPQCDFNLKLMFYRLKQQCFGIV